MFSGRAEQKILDWRLFRNQLTEWPDDIQKVVSQWARAPRSNIYLAYDDTSKWPDAWTLINDGIYCDISIPLGMFYTLYYSSYEHKDSMRLECYNLREKHQILNLLSLEGGKYMLNYHVDRPVNILSLENLPEPMHIVTATHLPIKN
jgi:hypothetical protein